MSLIHELDILDTRSKYHRPSRLPDVRLTTLNLFLDKLISALALQLLKEIKGITS